MFVETECPVCGETIGYYHGVYDEPIEVLCPNCAAVVAVLGDDYEEVEDDEIVLEEELDEDYFRRWMKVGVPSYSVGITFSV